MTEVNAEVPGESTDTKGKAPEDGRRPMGHRFISTVLMAADSAERWRQRRQPTAAGSRSNSGNQETNDDGDTIIAVHAAEPSTSTMSPTLASSSRTKPASAGRGDLHLDIPAVPKDAHTVPYNNTPGWQSPWTPHWPRRRSANLDELSGRAGEMLHHTPSETESERYLGPWGKRRRKLRRCILFNGFTPLVRGLSNLLLNVLVCSTAFS